MKTKTSKIHHYGIWIVLCIMLLFLSGMLTPILKESVIAIQYLILFIIFVLAGLSINQSHKVKDTYEKQDLIPHIHNIPTYVLLYPIIVVFVTFSANFLFGLLWSALQMVVFILIAGALGLGWIPGLILFIRDQKKLYQYKKNCNEYFRRRIVIFSIWYIVITLNIWWLAWCVFEFLQSKEDLF